MRQNLLRFFSIALLLPVTPTMSPARQNAAEPPRDDPRIEKLLSQLTLEEKISLLGGTGFATRPIPGSASRRST